MREKQFAVPFEFGSQDGKSTISAKLWTSTAFGFFDNPGEKAPKAVVLVVHGMSEYIDRYDGFARYLVDRGFVVCGEDLVGHGSTASSRDELGHIPARGGKDILLGDVHALHDKMAECFPGVPQVVYGHSMGSFIVRCLIARYGSDFEACVLSGTANMPVALSKAGRGLALALSGLRGETYRSKLIDGMGVGAYSKRIPDAETNFDWLSVNRDNVNAYSADAKCGFMFTVGGYSTLLDITAEMVSPEQAARIPKDLPILLVSGDGDPVGDMGKGVEAAADLMRNAGVRSVDVKLYEGMRHEIHFEDEGERVLYDIATWIEAHLPDRLGA